jgi:hypothetical protein
MLPTLQPVARNFNRQNMTQLVKHGPPFNKKNPTTSSPPGNHKIRS